MLITIISLFLFSSYKHPLILILRLIIQTISRFLIINTYQQNLWLSYIIFLIIVGGLLIIFSYLAALIPNEFFSTNNINFILIIILLMIFVIPAINSIVKPSLQVRSTIKFRYFFTEKTIIFIINYFILSIFIVIFLLTLIKSPLKIKITYVNTKNTPTYFYNKFLSN